MTLRTHTLYDYRDYTVCEPFAAYACEDAATLTPEDARMWERFKDYLYDTILQDGWRLAGWQIVSEPGMPDACAVLDGRKPHSSLARVVLRVHVAKTIQGMLPAYGSR